MRKVAIAALLMVFVCAAPALAQVPPDVELPEQTDVVADDQYDDTPELQSIENGLENAGEHAEEGGAAVGGTGAYVEALGNENPASASAPLPSDTYTELPDTGGFSPVLILAAGVLILGGVMLFWLAVSRR